MGSIILDTYIDNFGTNNIFWFFYILNLILSVIVYKLGFARRLPLLKSMIVYIFLAIGSIIPTFMSLIKFPMAESLLILSVIFGIYRFRLYRARQAKQ